MCDAEITIGDVTLSRVRGGWIVDTSGPVDLAQLDAVVQLAKQVPATPSIASALTIVGEGDGDVDVVSDARELLQQQAESAGDAFGVPDVEYGIGPVEYNNPVYSIHTSSADKLKELAESVVLKVPIKMLEVGNEYVPDKTFAGVTVTDETYAAWKQDVWPVWKLHEDGFIRLAKDGKTAEITQRGRVCLNQIEAGHAIVYDFDPDPPEPSDEQSGMVDNGLGGSIAYEWVAACNDVQQIIAANGDPQVIADGLWAVVQELKLVKLDDIRYLVDWACYRYERGAEVEAAIDKHIEAKLGGS